MQTVFFRGMIMYLHTGSPTFWRTLLQFHEDWIQCLHYSSPTKGISLQISKPIERFWAWLSISSPTACFNTYVSTTYFYLICYKMSCSPLYEAVTFVFKPYAAWHVIIMEFIIIIDLITVLSIYLLGNLHLSHITGSIRPSQEKKNHPMPQVQAVCSMYLLTVTRF